MFYQICPPRPLDEERMLDEIQFLTFDENLKTYLPPDRALLEKLDLKGEIKKFLCSGDLLTGRLKRDQEVKETERGGTVSTAVSDVVNTVESIAEEPSKSSPSPPLRVSTPGANVIKLFTDVKYEFS